MNGDGVVLEIVAQLDRVNGPAGVAPNVGILDVESIEAQRLLCIELQMTGDDDERRRRVDLHVIKQMEGYNISS